MERESLKTLQPKVGAHVRPVDLTGGESVYCINQTQMRRAVETFDKLPEDSPVRKAYDVLRELNRNDQATVAFLVIEELNKPRHL